MTTIPVHANAEIVIDDLIEMYIQWFLDTGSKMLNMTPEELIDFCNTPPGLKNTFPIIPPEAVQTVCNH